MAVMDDDQLLAQAAEALKQLSPDETRALSSWWRNYYLTLGHRKLGRLLLANRRAASTSSSRSARPRRSSSGRQPTFEKLTAVTAFDGLTIRYEAGIPDAEAAFSVELRGSELIIVLNRDHPVFLEQGEVISCLLDTQVQKSGELLVLDRLLRGWALYEISQPSAEYAERSKEVRRDWGRHARDGRPT